MTRTATALLAAAIASPMLAQTTTDYSQPTFDRWNYPFNFTPGTRTAASTFGAVGIPFAFDDRDAQFLNSFATGGQYAPGQGPQNYVITEATFTATLTDTGEFAYDNVLNPGSSIELFGTGFRGFFDAFSYGDSGTYAFGDPTAEDVRNAFVTDNFGGSSRDVSNEVRDGFASVPFAVGQIAGEAPGTVTANGQTVVFTLDLSNPDVVSYLQDSLNQGIVSLSVSSLHTASQGGPTSFPVFATSENTDGFAAPTFSITAEVIPAPASAALLGLTGLAGVRRRR